MNKQPRCPQCYLLPCEKEIHAGVNNYVTVGKWWIQAWGAVAQLQGMPLPGPRCPELCRHRQTEESAGTSSTPLQHWFMVKLRFACGLLGDPPLIVVIG